MSLNLRLTVTAEKKLSLNPNIVKQLKAKGKTFYIFERLYM